MPALNYKVNLTEDEKLGLEAMINKGKASARRLTRARILLKAAAGIQDKAIIQALAVSDDGVDDAPTVCGRRPGSRPERAPAPRT
jgi:hypothetical protein